MQPPLIALILTAPLWGVGATLAQNPATDRSTAPAAPTLTQSEAKPEAETASATQLATHPAIHTPGILQGWQLGGVMSHGRYREPGLMQLQGPRLGVWAAKSWSAWGHWQPTLQGRLQSSAMQYSSPISGELANVPDHELDLRLTALHPLTLSLASPWGPLRMGAYVGLGYRLHYNDLRGTTTQGHIGYRRLNQRLYLPLGLQLQTLALNSVTLSMAYTPALYGSHTTYMTDVGGTKDATAPQKSQGWLLQASWQPQPGWHLSAYHRQWTTKITTSWQSTINGVTQSYVEPASDWQETGIQLSRQF